MDFSVLICTPYSVEVGIVDAIISEINLEIDIKIIFRKKVLLQHQDIEILYPRLVNTHFFAKIVECLTSGYSEFILISADGVHPKVAQLKGRFVHRDGVAYASGIRGKFQKDNHSFEFVFHSTDTNSDSEDIGVWLFGQNFLELLAPHTI